jgi:superoxide reductase
MVDLNQIFQSADWKKEKHVPVIEVIGECSSGKPIQVNLTVGKEISHPNTTEHHIGWIDLYFLPDGGKFPYQIGKTVFKSHGASVDGPNTSTVYCDPTTIMHFKTEKSGTLFATSYCNIHGLWQNSLKLTLK